jgi:hypothetical protein
MSAFQLLLRRKVLSAEENVHDVNRDILPRRLLGRYQPCQQHDPRGHSITTPRGGGTLAVLLVLVAQRSAPAVVKHWLHSLKKNSASSMRNPTISFSNIFPLGQPEFGRPRKSAHLSI